jgi:hypothetical protein
MFTRSFLPAVPILSQMNPVHIVTYYFSKVRFNITSYLCLGLPSGLFPSGFPNVVYISNISHATCSDHLIILDLFTIIILGEEYKL